MKQKTQTRLIELLLSEGAMSRSEMARRLSVSSSLITEVTVELIEKGILYESGYKNAPGKGRRNQLLDIDISYGFAMGAGLYANTLSVGLCTIRGDTLSHRIINLAENATGEYIISEGIKAGREILSDCCIPVSKLFGLGICLLRSDLKYLGLSDSDQIRIPGIPESLPILIEPADRIISYSASTFMPVNPEGMYVFGCGRVIREGAGKPLSQRS